ncbi:hypothetical protein FKP32DRAFT_1274798 [Trametes sanguinea]|nr:hypothetical protein FKP32DRAFT_1274798 [Trametes sanguinea]
MTVTMLPDELRRPSLPSRCRILEQSSPTHSRLAAATLQHSHLQVDHQPELAGLCTRLRVTAGRRPSLPTYIPLVCSRYTAWIDFDWGSSVAELCQCALSNIRRGRHTSRVTRKYLLK